MPTLQMRPFQFASKNAENIYVISVISQLVFDLFSRDIPPDSLIGEATVPLTDPTRRRSGVSRLPCHLPYLEIKLTFACTTRFYGLAPPLGAISYDHFILQIYS